VQPVNRYVLGSDVGYPKQGYCTYRLRNSIQPWTFLSGLFHVVYSEVLNALVKELHKANHEPRNPSRISTREDT
jgi:hypothetical protein